jgi:NAD(P)-dependent dehydrogenase (short-subunit alcohol dehydrogenase family)
MTGERPRWAVILGASSGFGLATARKLGHHGVHLCLVHRDRRAALPAVEAEFDRLRAAGASVLAFNRDATDPAQRDVILDELRAAAGAGAVRLLLHSIAFGNLKPLAPPPHGDGSGATLTEDDFAHTIHAMGTSLVGWVHGLHRRQLFAPDARVLGLTSEGNTLAWPGYAAVSAAKVALEAVSRALATEFAPYGVRANVVQPGITDTPALRRIPGHEAMKTSAARRNPFGRLTTPEDVADAIYLLSLDEAAWINGALIRVDGGEHVAGR